MVPNGNDTDNPGLNETPIVALSFGVLEKHLNALWRLWTDVPLDWKLKSLDLANRIYGVQYKKDQIGNSSKAIRRNTRNRGANGGSCLTLPAEVRRIEQEQIAPSASRRWMHFEGRSTTIDGLASISSGLLDKTGGAYGYRMFRGDGDDAEPDPVSTGRLTTADTTASARQLLARACGVCRNAPRSLIQRPAPDSRRTKTRRLGWNYLTKSSVTCDHEQPDPH